MFFPDRVVSINPGDRVLEIGPGGTPHPRSDVLLEKIFHSPDVAEEQRGYCQPLKTKKRIVFYQGGNFPFQDKEFDYVICSHVLEHVEDVDLFAQEMVRVGKKGYLEYPRIYYEYLYNFNAHLNLLHNVNGTLYWMKKSRSGLQQFAPVQDFFYRTLCKGYEEMVQSLKEYFFEGYEWFDTVDTAQTADILHFCLEPVELDRIKANTAPGLIARMTRLIKAR